MLLSNLALKKTTALLRQSLLTAAAIALTASAAASEPQAVSYSLLTEPDQGLSSIYDLIGAATKTIDLTMYELSDTTAEKLLAQAAADGVKVRVILDQNLEKSNNESAYSYLSQHGVSVHWANKKYHATHQKTLTIDGATSAIMTLNMTPQYYSTTRDFAVIENDSNDVAAIEAIFNKDFTNSTVTPGDGDDLVWSPTNALTALEGIIDGAKYSLQIENEEMSDSSIVSALESAAKKGVNVEIIMTSDGSYDSEFTALKKAGAHVVTYTEDAPLYIHAKVILADYGKTGANVFIGSENFSNDSLTENRELGLTTSNTSILSSINSTLTSDYQGGTPY